ncbi:hypothetical protein AB833_23275 [Chromatiales bacterium (ex Bugula neritina AB1)]|nr:hypothetical protein AB833_23275 [Chromatiales bacterium (ex Bugula neritina AB1)]
MENSFVNLGDHFKKFIVGKCKSRAFAGNVTGRTEFKDLVPASNRREICREPTPPDMQEIVYNAKKKSAL